MEQIMWYIVANIYNFTFSVFFFVLAGFMFLIASRGFKSNNRYGGRSTGICGMIFVILGYANLFLPRENGKFFGLLPYPFNGFMIWWIGIIMIISFIFGLIMRKNIKKIKHLKIIGVPLSEINVKLTPLQKYVVMIKNESPYKEQIPFRMELIRKTFHLSGILILIAYYGFFFLPPLTSLINDAIIIFINQTEGLYNVLWGDIILQYPFSFSDHKAVINLTFFALIAALFFSIISELIRVLLGSEYSLFNVITKSVLRNNEFNAIGPQIYLLAGVILSYLFYIMGLAPGDVIMAAILIACLSDALAAIIGRRYGQHKVKCINGDIKSIEGFIAGMGSAFLIGLIPLGPFYALVGAIILFLIDYFPISIADNVLNPIMITVGIMIIGIITGFPIGLGFFL